MGGMGQCESELDRVNAGGKIGLDCVEANGYEYGLLFWQRVPT